MEAIPSLESFFDHHSSLFFHSSSLLYSITLLFHHQNLLILLLPSCQIDQSIAPVTPANPAAIHDAVSTHLRPRRGGRAVLPSTLIPAAPTTPKSTTILERRLTRKALLDAQITPEARRVPSPYRHPTASSPYVFDHDFYNNEDIMNGDVSFEDAVFGCQTNRQRKHLHQAHESIISNNQIDTSFEAMDMPNPPRPMRARLSDSCDIKKPATFFEMFMGDEQFDMLARHTNAYAQYQLANFPARHKSRKSWRDTNRQEIKVFIAILIFQGHNRNTRPKSHWEDPIRDSPIHRMRFNRYKALMAFFKVSDIADDLDTADTNDTKREDWHKKLTPLDTHL